MKPRNLPKKSVMARVLVVDDQQSILMMLESILIGRGHVVTTVTNPHDALDKLDAFPFDLLVTDIVMPGGVSGFDLVKAVKSNARYVNLPIVMLSGRREKRDIDRGIEIGVDDYIVKPVDPDLFIAKVESLLKRKAPESFDFKEVSFTEKFQWDVINEITGVSEIGLTLRSALQLETGAKVKITSPVLEELGLNLYPHRVVSCKKAKSDLNYFIIKTHFIGLTESALRPLRLWIRSQQIKSAS